VVVIGNGPIGSAVSRHVAYGGASVLVIDGRGSLTSASDDLAWGGIENVHSTDVESPPPSSSS
jgi:hypothetical protein